MKLACTLEVPDVEVSQLLVDRERMPLVKTPVPVLSLVKYRFVYA
jgi:hypothetical protein